MILLQTYSGRNEHKSSHTRWIFRHEARLYWATAGVCTHPQTVDTFKRISALLGLPFALSPALSARSVGGVGGCVWTLCVGPTLDTDSIILPLKKKQPR